MPTPTSPAQPLNGGPGTEAPPPLAETLAALRHDPFDAKHVARLSDLTREDARELGRAWGSFDDTTREAIVRRVEELSEERMDLVFGRALRIALEDESPVVRQLAVAALWEDQGDDLLGRFRDLLAFDPSQDVRAEAARALDRFAERAAIGDLDDAVGRELRAGLTETARDDRNPIAVRRRALESVGVFGDDDEVRDLIRSAYDDEDEGIRASALCAMGRSLDERWIDVVLDELAGKEAELRFEAARASGLLGDERAVPELTRLVLDEDAEVRHAAFAALGQIGGRAAVQALRSMAVEPEEADVEAIEAALEEATAVDEPIRVGR